MKKWLLPLFAAIALFLALSFMLIPSTYEFDSGRPVRSTAGESGRLLADLNNWHEALRLAPDQSELSLEKDGFQFRERKFTLNNRVYGQYSFIVTNSGDSLPLLVQVLPQSNNSIWLLATFSEQLATSPFRRISEYLEVRKTALVVEELLAILENYLQRREELYDKQIVHSTVKDTTFLSTRFITSTYPPAREIYSRIDSLRAYISSEGASVTGDPMLHTLQLDSNRFESMVALPTDRQVKASARFQPKRMIRGNILVYEFIGGEATTRQSLLKMQEYVSDHKLVSPAIPYVSLVTDRRAEPDTLKWISRIYYPIY